jgi:tetratricopeptide (TPR) repeat protein
VPPTPCKAFLPAVAALALGLPLPAAAPDAPARPPTGEQVARWVHQLGDGDFEVREKASRALWQAGRAAEPALRRALKDHDAEVVRRARDLLDKFDWGVYPDTPGDVVKLIDAYRSADPNARPNVVTQLLDEGVPGFTALLKVAAAETAPEARRAVWQVIGVNMPRLAGALLADGQFDRLEEFLEEGLRGGDGVAQANYAAFLLFRGKLDAAVARWKKRADADAGPSAAHTLAYLYRARGDLAAARRYAEKAAQPELRETLLIEQEDWKALLEYAGTASGPDGAPLTGLRLACLHLVGDEDGLDVELRKLADDPNAPALGPAPFLLNGRPEEALAALARYKDHAGAFDVLVAQLRFAEAFAEVERAKAAGEGDLFDLELNQARTYARLGEMNKARKVFGELAGRLKTVENPSHLQMLVSTEYEAGFKDRAFADGARWITKVGEANGNTLNALVMLFPHLGGSHEVWWKFLRQKYPRDDVAATLERMRNLLGPRAPARDLAAAFREAAGEANRLDPAERAQWFQALADTARDLGRDELEEVYVEQWAAAQEAPQAFLRRGDLLTRKKRWREAAESYWQAWEADRASALPLYLRGWALAQAGREKEGQRWMDLAVLLPLGVDVARSDLITGLAERGLTEAAGREWERFGRLHTPRSGYADTIARELAARAVAGRDPLRAARYTQRAMLFALVNQGGDFPEVDEQLALALSVREQRARGLAALGRLDEARQEVGAVLAVCPGRLELALTVVPELTRRGYTKDADELYARVLAFHDALCKEHPGSAWCHNNLAWLSARCRRDLDVALVHARKAVELEPDNAGYLDTLAETYFQRGDKARAIEAEKRAIELQPRGDYFRLQLKRLRAGDPAADPPRDPGVAPRRVPFVSDVQG